MDCNIELFEEILEELENKKHKRSYSEESNSDSNYSKENKNNLYEIINIDPKKYKEDKIKRDMEIYKEQLEEAKKKEEEAQREENTVLINGLPLKADKNNIYSFLKNHNTGKVKDIQLIIDKNTKKSKGMAYVEFYTQESVINALALTNKYYDNQYKISVYPTEYKKNKAHLINKTKLNTSGFNNDFFRKNEDDKKKKGVLIKNLIDTLSYLKENDIEKIFKSFGDIEYIKLKFNPHTGKNYGFAIVQYYKKEDARTAIKKMNGFKIKDIPIYVSNVTENYMDENKNMNSQYLRNKITTNISKIDFLLNPELKELNEIFHKRKDIKNTPSSTIVITNLYNIREINLNNYPNYFQELKNDILSQCENYGKVEKLRFEKDRYGTVWVKFYNRKYSVEAIKSLKKKQYEESITKKDRQLLVYFGYSDCFPRK